LYMFVEVKMKTRRLICILTAMLVMMAAFGTARAQDKVVITWWHINTNAPEGEYWQKVADDYMAANPNVTIEITILENQAFKDRLVTVMQAGDPPDLFQSWGGGVLWQFAKAGLVRDISPELTGEWEDSFSAKSALELFKVDEAAYGVPWTWGAVGIFYNKALFKKAGLDPEKPPATWSEFLEAVKALKAAGITPIALGEQEKWPGHFWWVYLAMRLGGEKAFLDAYNRTGGFADESFVQAGEYLKQLIDLEPFPDDFLALGYAQQAGLMGDGLAAMELMGHWSPGAQKGLSSSSGAALADQGWFPFPVVEGGAGSASDILGGGDGFAVGIKAEDETIDFLRYITSAEVQRGAAEIWVVPVITDCCTKTIEASAFLPTILAARDNAEYFQLYYDQFLPPALGQAVNDNVEAIFAGVYSAQEAADAIEAVAKDELEN
jgi:raffinose/stachyose/melibiose transport system substrate-binding protein